MKGNLHHVFIRTLALAVVAMLTACAQLGLTQPETFNQKLAVAYGSVTEVRNTALTLLVQRRISTADAQHVQQAADGARAGLDIARDEHAINPAVAEAKLNALRSTLTALSTYLTARAAATKP